MSEFIDEEECHWGSYDEYVFSKFGYWAYDRDTADKVKQVLRELYFGNGKSGEGYFIRASDGFEWAFQALLLEILSSHNITEYGTSPRGSWLTEKGRTLLTKMFEGEREEIAPHWRKNE